ncbi:squalene/phytoene synthase family protein [Marinobacterium rhizophilum]|uniref:Squalene/phytoene synthase family protein n=1 Tax=Marinobacterium rhizophilum TaxID=420402 RepID=A0ABY5HHC4_9GAMM|nr:squalene/phytoene synthase family protein [Marinobacterium rhizophilum]UTW11761.1 squalene/phytoene synthase family protein [Marinobacterium rhizophilum]
MKNKNSPARDFCYQALRKVSRSFYVNTVALRNPIRDYVCVAYLLCRIADTIEDDPALGVDAKAQGFALFKDSLTAGVPEAGWQHFVASLDSSDDERELALNFQRVLGEYDAFPRNIRDILKKHVFIMADGMLRYCVKLEGRGESIENFSQLDDYCYYVAGVVGELLTAVFSEEMDIPAGALVQLQNNAVAFGLALQYVNIINDYATDSARGIVFWPDSCVDQRADDQAPLREMSRRCLDYIVDSFEYVRHIPRKECTVRGFCLLPLFFAVATLKQINKDRSALGHRKKVKISRKRVRFIFFFVMAFSRFDFILDAYFRRNVAFLRKYLSA